MSRSSDIGRAGMERRVETLAAAGSIPPQIAEAVSQESGHNISTASVRRHLAKQSVNATVPATEEYGAVKRLAAAISGLTDVRDTDISSYFGKYKLNTTNNFTQYYGIARGIGNGQVSRAFKNIALKITSGARIVGDERDADRIDALSKAINFSSLLQNVVRYTCEMGTCLVGMTSKDVYVQPDILPVEYYTLLTDSETIGEVSENQVNGTVTKIVFDEMGSKRKAYTRDEIGIVRIWEGGNKVHDIAGRSTFGIYGESMTIGVETPLKSLLNSSYYYDEFIHRYGLGRLHINLKLLSDMIKEGTIEPTAAKETHKADTAAMQKLGPNEDIISTGQEVSMIESKTGFAIVPYLEWRRKQIDRTLLQSDVGAGDVGSAWTSAGTAVMAQDYDTYMSLRETIFSQFLTEIIAPRCEEFALDPKKISISATPLSQVDVPFAILVEMRDRGDITESELRERCGFPEVKPEEEW